MKKILMVFGMVSLGCVGMEKEPLWVTVPGTTQQLDLNEKDPIIGDIFKDLAEEEGGVDIVAIPTGVRMVPYHYFPGEVLRDSVKENLYVNPVSKQFFYRKDLKVFNVKKMGPYYVTVEKNVFDVLPQGLAFDMAQEFLDTSSALHPNTKKTYLEKVAEQDDNHKAKAQAELLLGRVQTLITAEVEQDRLMSEALEEFEFPEGASKTPPRIDATKVFFEIDFTFPLCGKKPKGSDP